MYLTIIGWFGDIFVHAEACVKFGGITLLKNILSVVCVHDLPLSNRLFDVSQRTLCDQNYL